MFVRRVYLAAVLAFALGLSAGYAPAAAEELGEGAAEFVQSLSNRTLEMLRTSEISEDERLERFHALLREAFDISAIGAFVLGRYWRTATQDQRAEYLRLFEDYIVLSYSARLGSVYSGEGFEINRVLPQGDDGVLVRGRITSEKNPPIRVDWYVRRPQNVYKVVDVRVEGVSMVRTQRDEFTSVIQRKGGEVEGLLEVLREKIAQLESE